MNRFNKVSALLTVAFVMAVIFITPASALMSNPISKFNSINSMTSKTDLTINLSASGLSEQDQENFDMIQPMIDDMRISTISKFEKNPSGILGNEYMHLMMNIGGTPIDTSIWAKTDLTDKTPSIKEIIRVPKTLSEYLPTEAQGKEYAVLDMSKQADAKYDWNKFASASSKLVDAVTNSVTSLPAGLLPIKDRGTSKLKTSEGVINVHNYTLKLDDNTLKLLMKYSVNNLSTNKNVITALKDYLIAVNASDGKEAKELSNGIDKEIPGFIKDFNTSMDNLKNTKIVGKKGIVINYSVNGSGYIVNANGVVDLAAKASDINQFDNTNNDLQVSKDSGIYDLTVKFNSNMYNINKGTKVTLPYLNKKNSFDLFKVMDGMNGVVNQ